MLITLSREFGAGGSSVARAVADRLGWRVVDNQLLQEIARRAGLTVDEARERVERGPTFVDRLARALAASTPESLTPSAVQPPEAEDARIKRITEQVVAEAAENHAVLVGRAAAALIDRREGALHIRLVASLDYRVNIIATRLELTPAEAERRIRDEDAHRAEYHRHWYHRDWTDPRHYHLVVNTGWVGLERTADLIVGMVDPEPRAQRPEARALRPEP